MGLSGPGAFRCTSIGTQSGRSTLSLVERVASTGKRQRSSSVLREGLLLTPAAPDLLEREIRLLLDLRRTTDARAACRGLLRLQPLDGMTWYLLARVLMQNKRPGLAIRALDRAKRLSPDSSDLWRHIGWLSWRLATLICVGDS